MEDADRALRVQVLLADHEARQRDIDQRTSIDAQTFAVLFGMTATVIAALFTTEIWHFELPPGLQALLPSGFILLSVLSLWFPVNNLYHWMEVRTAARYSAHRVVSALREVLLSLGGTSC